jgi:hypothetical protein
MIREERRTEGRKERIFKEGRKEGQYIREECRRKIITDGISKDNYNGCNIEGREGKTHI